LAVAKASWWRSSSRLMTPFLSIGGQVRAGVRAQHH